MLGVGFLFCFVFHSRLPPKTYAVMAKTSSGAYRLPKPNC